MLIASRPVQLNWASAELGADGIDRSQGEGGGQEDDILYCGRGLDGCMSERVARTHLCLNIVKITLDV